jgi:hypothetical protein
VDICGYLGLPIPVRVNPTPRYTLGYPDNETLWQHARHTIGSACARASTYKDLVHLHHSLSSDATYATSHVHTCKQYLLHHLNVVYEGDQKVSLKGTQTLTKAPIEIRQLRAYPPPHLEPLARPSLTDGYACTACTPTFHNPGNAKKDRRREQPPPRRSNDRATTHIEIYRQMVSTSLTDTSAGSVAPPRMVTVVVDPQSLHHLANQMLSHRIGVVHGLGSYNGWCRCRCRCRCRCGGSRVCWRSSKRGRM